MKFCSINLYPRPRVCIGGIETFVRNCHQPQLNMLLIFLAILKKSSSEAVQYITKFFGQVQKPGRLLSKVKVMRDCIYLFHITLSIAFDRLLLRLTFNQIFLRPTSGVNLKIWKLIKTQFSSDQHSIGVIDTRTTMTELDPKICQICCYLKVRGKIKTVKIVLTFK